MQYSNLLPFETLAGKLGVSQEVIWNSTIKEAQISGVILLVAFLLLGCAGLFALYFIHRIRKKTAVSKETQEALTPISILIVFTILLITPVFADLIVGYLFNPEYRAIEDISRMLSK